MTRKEMINEWGLEVILRCSCGDTPSHFMDGRVPRCPVCGEKMEMLHGENWEAIKEKYSR